MGACLARKAIMGNTNLVRNPSFDGPLSGNWALDADYSLSASGGNISPSCIAQSSTGNFANFTSQNDAAGGYVVVPSTSYVFSFYAKIAVSSGNPPQTQINKTSAFGTSLATLSLADTGGVYQRFSLSFTTGASDTEVWFRLFNNGGNVVAHYDNMQLEQGSAATPYFDGAQPGCEWTGTPNNSTSILLGVLAAVSALGRDGKVNAYGRDGKVTAIGR